MRAPLLVFWSEEEVCDGQAKSAGRLSCGRKKKLWSGISGAYELRPDELRILEDACREADLIDSMVKWLDDDDIMTIGSTGQPVVNPLVSEVRQHRTVLSSLMRQLKLPDDGNVEKEAGERSASARTAANARWSRRGA